MSVRPVNLEYSITSLVVLAAGAGWGLSGEKKVTMTFFFKICLLGSRLKHEDSYAFFQQSWHIVVGGRESETRRYVGRINRSMDYVRQHYLFCGWEYINIRN